MQCNASCCVDALFACVLSFSGDRLDGYQKKKYVCKLVFMFLLGNDIDFGYQEAVNLLSSSRFSEKQIVSICMQWLTCQL